MLRIKEARQRAGLLQKNMAKELGIDPSTLHGYESGKHTPTPQMLRRIADICGVTVDYLVGAEEDPFSKRFRERVRAYMSTLSPSEIRAGIESGSPYNEIIDMLDQHYPISLAEAGFTAGIFLQTISEMLGEEESDFFSSVYDALPDEQQWGKFFKTGHKPAASDKSARKEPFEQKYNALTPAHKKIIDDVISAFLIQQKKSEE